MVHPIPGHQYCLRHSATLRQANRYYSTIFLNELLPINAKQIVAQVENLRSNNSKEALTLLTEVVETQELTALPSDVIRPIVAALMAKSVSEKGFLKSQALKGANALPRKWNEAALDELCLHTQAANGQISELAMRLVGEMLENNKEWRVDGKFLKSLSGNLNGKRALVQKKAREILRNLKEREGEGPLEEKINSSSELLEEESNTLRR
jgi:formate dehydrogenase maturation protein FdhE